MTSTLPLLRRRLARLGRAVRREHALGVLWIGTLLSLEVLGRSSPSDVVDIAGVLTLLFLVIVTHYAHWIRPIPAITALRALGPRLVAGLERFQCRVGQDLRLEPPLPRRLPGVLRAAGAVSVAVTAGLWLGRSAFPTAAREAMLGGSAVLYFVALALLWTPLIAGSFTALATPLSLRGWLAERGLFPSLRRIPALFSFLTVVYLLALLTVASTQPVWIPLAASGAAWIASGFGLLAPGGPRLTLLWRPVRGGDAATFEHATFFVFGSGLVWCGLCTVALVASGDRVDGGAASETAMTAMLGSVFAWSTSIAYAHWALARLVTNVIARRRDPARPQPAVVRVVELPARSDAGGAAGAGPDEGGESVRAPIRAALEAGGFVVRFGTPPDAVRPTPTEVRIRVRDRVEPSGELMIFDEWPLAVAAPTLADEAVQHKLARRDAILRRRHFLRGLRRAHRRFRQALRPETVGVWIDPHLWFSRSLVQELESEDPRAPVGPPYHEVMPLASRSHLYGVLRALEVDLVFAERGVRFKQLRRVYEVLFETYDVHGGAQRIEERHFRTLSGLRVVIDLVTPDRGRRASSYPEPDYEDFARARILHVFRDRGERRDVSTRPRETNDAPQPMLV